MFRKLSIATSGKVAFPKQKAPLWESLWTITLVALAIRLVAIHFLYRDTWNDFRDHLLFGFETGRIARSIALGHGFGNPMFVQTGPTAWMTPVYPYLLAATFKLFGIYSRTSAFVMLAFNGLCSSLICIPVYFAALRSFGRAVAVLATWMWALFPYSIYISSAFVWETCLSALLLAVLFAWTLRLRGNPASLTDWLGYGALWGFSVLTNASLLSLVPFLTCWASNSLKDTRKLWLSRIFFAVLGFVIILLPWQVRNYRTFHRFIPLRDNFWLELWVGNDGATYSQSDDAAHPTTNQHALEEYVRLGEIPFMQKKRAEALSFIARHPGFFVVMCFRRFVYMWTAFWSTDRASWEIEIHTPASILLTIPLTVIMLFGLWHAYRYARDATIPFLICLIAYPLIFCITHPEIRYRHLIDPEIIILAALGARFMLLGPKATHSPASSA